MNDSIQNVPTLPQKRSRLRLSLGRWYFTGRRYLDWIRSDQQYAHTIQPAARLPYQVISHQTPILRRLRNVDMQLQYNKRTNLQLACHCINGLVLQPGQTFSFWKLVGEDQSTIVWGIIKMYPF